MKCYSKRHRNFSAKLVAEVYIMKNSSMYIDEFMCIQLVICTNNMSKSRDRRCRFQYFFSTDTQSPCPTFQKLMGKIAVLTELYNMLKDRVRYNSCVNLCTATWTSVIGKYRQCKHSR